MNRGLVDKEPFLANALKVEINVMKSLKGKHVVRFLDELDTQNNHYIVLEFCNGGDLSNYLWQN